MLKLKGRTENSSYSFFLFRTKSTILRFTIILVKITPPKIARYLVNLIWRYGYETG